MANSLIGNEEKSPNEDELIHELSQLSREFSRDNISQIIPINFDTATVEGIGDLLDKYRSFLSRKSVALQNLQVYLRDLTQCLDDAKKYFDQNKKHAEELVNQCPRLKKALSRSPQVRTKDNPKSPSFFNR